MTAKEKLRNVVEELSEAEAADTLRLIELRDDPMIAAFRDAPIDDEPFIEDDAAALDEARADVAAGRTKPL